MQFRGFIFSFTLLLSAVALHAQSKSKQFDSLRVRLMVDSLWTYRPKLFRPYLVIDNRRSFITKEPVNLLGFQVGVRYREKNIFGMGAYSISRLWQKPLVIIDGNNKVQRLELDYGTLFYKHRLFCNRYLDVFIPFEMGFGIARARMFDSTNKIFLRSESVRIFPISTGLMLVLKPMKWFGLSAAGGYRHVNEGNIHFNFNGWYYSFGLWLDFRQVYRDTKYYGFVKRKYRRKVKEVLRK